MYFNLKTIETNPDVAKYQPGRVREGIAFLLNCENSVSCSRHIIRSEWVEVCSLGPAVSPGSLNTLVHLLVVIPKMVKGQGRIIKWTAQKYCIQHSLAQGNNAMRYGGLWSQTADRRIKIKHYQELLPKINAQAQRWVSSLQRRAEQIYFSKEHISPHRSLIDRHLGVEGHQPENIVAPGRGYWAHSLHSCSSIRDLFNITTPSHSSQLSCYTCTSKRAKKFCFLSNSQWTTTGRCREKVKDSSHTIPVKLLVLQYAAQKCYFYWRVTIQHLKTWQERNTP